MNPSCLLCNQISPHRAAPFLCVQCYGLLEPATAHEDIYSLYRYNSALRNLILKVKIHGNYRALACLTYLFLNPTKDILKTCEAIIPAPSSLWSRMRGRIDLAFFLSSSLAKHEGLKLRKAPIELHWQVKKRSKTAKRESIMLGEMSEKTNEESYILIVDDVVTSGHTLQRTARALREKNCRFLTLASALH